MRSRQKTLVIAMVFAVVTVAVIAIVDQQRTSATAIEDFAREQGVLARAVATGMELHLAALPDATTDEQAQSLLGAVKHLERPGQLQVVLQRPNAQGFLTSDGRLLASSVLDAAFAAGSDRATFNRDQAVELGLVRRLAVAGLDHADGPKGRWNVAVTASAAPLRDRERHGILRVLFSVLLAALVVLGFGGLALRLQRIELMRERDTLLARADRLATVAALSSGIAHELATPLAVISARLEQLTPLSQSEPGAARATVAISEQLKRIEAVMRGFLSLARGDAPTLAPEPARALVERVVELVSHRYRAAQVSLELVYEAPDARVRCDARLLEQALANLLLNACEASTSGGSVVFRVTREAELLSLQVLDRGSGLSKEALERATEPFFTTKRAKDGTGLGLAIAREIVSHHQGTLSLAGRDDGPGAVATVTLKADWEILPMTEGASPDLGTPAGTRSL